MGCELPALARWRTVAGYPLELRGRRAPRQTGGSVREGACLCCGRDELCGRVACLGCEEASLWGVSSEQTVCR